MKSRTGIRFLSIAGGAALVVATCVAAFPTASPPDANYPAVVPAVSDFVQISSSATPPTQAQCASAGRRCFTPQSTRAAYNMGPLYADGHDGHGITIAIVDSYGSDTMAHDLHVYNQAFNLPSMCGEEAVTCTPGMPIFSRLSLQGSPATKAPMRGSSPVSGRSSGS